MPSAAEGIGWAADVLRAAGVDVVEVHGWRKRGNGRLYADAVVWHHDGSGVGASPNIPGYIARQVDAGKPGANIWVALDGTWHLIAAGLTFHAGRVLSGKPGNSQSIGIETDHTTGETWSGVDLLASLRVGTAALLNHMGQDASRLEFHKTICSPVGRKNDPDGLDLAAERRAVIDLMHPREDDDMAYKDWDKASKMMLANDVASVLLDRLSEDGPKFTSKAAERLKKAAHAAQHVHDHLKLKD